jgi:hypothetical protein
MTDLPSIRSVMPWWYVGGAVVALAVGIVLVALGAGETVGSVAMWGPMIGIEIRARRLRVAAHPEAAASRGRTGPAWSEPVVAGTYLPISIGLGALLAQVPFLRSAPVEPVAVMVGAALVLVPAALAATSLLILVRRRRASRA